MQEPSTGLNLIACFLKNIQTRRGVSLYGGQAGNIAMSTTIAMASSRGVLSLPGSSSHVSVCGWYLRMVSPPVSRADPPTNRKVLSYRTL